MDILFNRRQLLTAQDFIETYEETTAKIMKLAAQKAAKENCDVMISFYCRHTPTGMPQLILDTDKVEMTKLHWESCNTNVALSPRDEDDEDTDFIGNVHVILAK